MSQSTALKQHLTAMSRFHKAAYERLLPVLASLSEDDYRADRELFFKSFHGTVNHLHLVDCLWLWRLQGVKPEFWVTGLDMEVEADRARLFELTLERASALENWVASAEEADLLKTVGVSTMSSGKVERPAHLLVMTPINHGTHHRGQICAALTRMGVDYPPLDLPYYEGLVDE